MGQLLTWKCHGDNAKHHIHSSVGQLSSESAMGLTLNTTSAQPWVSCSLESAMGITVNATSTHPWDSSHLRVPWDYTKHHIYSSVGQVSLESAMGLTLNTTCPYPWVSSCLRVPYKMPHPLIHGTALTWECHGTTLNTTSTRPWDSSHLRVPWE